MPIPQNAIINPEADRRLGRIALTYGVIVFILLIVTTLLVSVANAGQNPKTLGDLIHSPQLAALNLLSILVVLIPFYVGIHRLFTARLEIGRERVQARAWREAVAALEPFDVPMQRFLDGSGEAHYLLAQAYAGLGDKQKAETARKFVRRKKGVWAEKLSPGKAPVGMGKGQNGKGAGVYPAPWQENRPRPAKSKPRRRF
ncbi:MAG: hypothetical protein M3Y13_08230 [Armatimonadota bacterium]|nr:hypothetical protein [Armatimonadota bacterium]